MIRMPPQTLPGIWCTAWLWGMAICLAGPTGAQAQAMADARIESLDPAQAEQLRLRMQLDSAPPVYQDRFMDLDVLATQVEAIPEAEQPQGLRAWLLESRVGLGDSSTTGYGRLRATEFGQRLEYRHETLSHGEFALQLDARHLSGDNSSSGLGMGVLGYARDASSARFTLRNLAFPLTPRSFADTAVGDVFSELTDGLTRNYRLSFGSTPVRGASLRLYSSGWDVRAGLGQRGNLTGGPYPGFEKSQGTLAWLGGTLRLQGPWFAALQINQAQAIPAYYYDPLTAQGIGRRNVSSWAASLGRGRELLREGDFKLRATVLGSQSRSSMPGDSGSSQGLFVEAGVRAGAYRHEFGTYVTRPRLYFGDYGLATASRGAYWRVDRSASRLAWGAGLDYERARPGGDFGLSGYERTGASGNLQYLFDRRSSVGGSLSMHQTRYDGAGAGGSSANGRGLWATAFYQTRFFEAPRSRLSLTLQRNELIVLGDSAATGQELQWEQDWIGGRYETMRPELTSTIGYARDRSGGTSRRYPTAGLQWRYWMDSGTHLAGNLRYTSQSGGLYTNRGLSGSLTAEKSLGQGWRIGFSTLFNQTRASLLPTPSALPNVYRSNEKAAYVYLRWEGSAGTAFATAGVPGEGAGAGAGSLSGRVFYDANRDGEQQAGEGGVAGVEVLLDGRYRTLTDRDGRFEFPMVTTGHHRLSLTLESVPLPWGAAGDNGVAIHVPLRGHAVAAIAVVKVGE